MPSTTINQEAKELFEKHIKGANAMTPYLRGYGVQGGFAYEFTEGKDMEGKPLYGITVLERESGHRRFDLSTCFSTLEAADAHIKNRLGGSQ